MLTYTFIELILSTAFGAKHLKGIVYIPLILALVISLFATYKFYRNISLNVSEFWVLGKVKLAQFFMMLGHLGVISAIVLLSQMSIGAASGLLLIPGIFWAGFWYILGITLMSRMLSINSHGRVNA